MKIKIPMSKLSQKQLNYPQAKLKNPFSKNCLRIQSTKQKALSQFVINFSKRLEKLKENVLEQASKDPQGINWGIHFTKKR
jgi:hypothetical protein